MIKKETKQICYVFHMHDEIPEDWEIRKFGDFSTEKKEKLSNQSNPLILSMSKHVGFVKSLEYFKKQVFSKNISKYKLVKKGDFAYATIHLDEGSVGLLKEFEEGFVSPMYTVFSVDESINRDYLFYLMKSSRFLEIFSAMGVGSVERRKSVKFSDLKNLSIPVPKKIEEQRKIASILLNMDKSIFTITQIIEKNQLFKKTIIQKIFSEGMNHSKFKNYFWKDHSTILLDSIPDDWKIKTVKELKEEKVILELQDGNHGELHPKVHDFSENGRPFITVTQIDDDGKIDLVNCKKLPEEYCEKLRIGFCKPNDVLFSHNAVVGRVAILPIGSPNCIVGTSVTYYRLNPKKIDRRFFAHVLTSQFIKQQYRRDVDQSTRQQFSILKQETLRIPLPKTIEEQQKIGEIVYRIENNIQNKKSQKILLEQLKKGLMQKLLTGQIR
jgi:type I restriction enzyme, S subunit